MVDENASSLSALGRWSPRRLVAALFGFDFFISYAHEDGHDYAQALSAALEGEPYGFKTHIDTRDYLAGQDLDRLTRIRVRNSRKLVVVASECALIKSKWVRLEVDTYTETGNLPIVVEFHDVQETLAATNPTPGKLLEWTKTHPSVLRIVEATATKAPTSEAQSKLAASFEGTRIEKRRARIVSGTILGLAGLLVATVGLLLVANELRRQAVVQQEQIRLELSRGDASRALTYLVDGQDDAAAAFLSRAREVHHSPLSSLVGHMVPLPRYVPHERSRLPDLSGRVEGVWSDPTGRYIAVAVAGEENNLKVFDWTGAVPRLVYEQSRQSWDPLIAVVSAPRPAMISRGANEGRPYPGRLELVWLDDPVANAVSIPVEVATGYDGLIRLADGRFYFSRGPRVTAVTITNSEVSIDVYDSGLLGHVNELSATEGGQCYLLSDTSGRVVITFLDERPAANWDSRSTFEEFEGVNPNHIQGLVDGVVEAKLQRSAITDFA